MKAKEYVAATRWIFALVFVLHGLRIINGWEAIIGYWIVPMWASWLAVGIAGYLAYYGMKIVK